MVPLPFVPPIVGMLWNLLSVLMARGGILSLLMARGGRLALAGLGSLVAVAGSRHLGKDQQGIRGWVRLTRSQSWN